MLEIIFSTKTYKNRVSKRPKIITNEGPPDKNVQIIAHIIQRPDSTYPVVISPYKLDMSQFTKKVRDKITFQIKNVSDIALTPTLIHAPQELFELKLPGSIAPGESGEAVLTLHKDVLEKSFEKSITIEFDDDKGSRFTVPIKRTVRVTKSTGSTKTTGK